MPPFPIWSRPGDGIEFVIAHDGTSEACLNHVPGDAEHGHLLGAADRLQASTDRDRHGAGQVTQVVNA